MSADAGAQPLGPDSLTWELGFSRPLLLLAGRALLMQVAHPVVGAGVRDHSTFQADPWTRFTRTVDSLARQLLGGPEASAEADRLAGMHRTITGTGFDGNRYHALDPEAGAWVHLVNYDSVVEAHRLLATPLDPADASRLYREWCQVGRLLGIPQPVMPSDVDELGDYMATMVATRLGDNISVRNLLHTLTMRDVAAPSPAVPEPLWHLARRPASSVARAFTVGTLPPALRDKLGLEWTNRDQRRLEWLAGAVRTVTPAVPDRWVHHELGRQARYAATRYAAARRVAG